MNNFNKNIKRERFVKLANIRTNDILKKIRVLGNLSVRSRYDYTIDDINIIFSEINMAIKQSRSRFEPRNKEKRLIIK